MKPEEKVILYDSPEAAQIVSLKLLDGTPYGKGWVSANMRFYTIEHQARTDGATHRKCESCGNINKINRYCHPCHEKKRHAQYLAKPFMEYDGSSMLTLHDDDRFFMDEDEVREYCVDNDMQPEDLSLVVCEPNKMSKIDSGYWADDMPTDGDGELPKEVQAALDALNAIIENQAPISWSAGVYRTTIRNEAKVAQP